MGCARGLTSRPCVSAGAMNERRSNAIPIPANAASVTPLESVNTGPRRAMCGASPTASHHSAQSSRCSSCSSGYCSRSLASVSVRRGAIQLRATDRHQVVIQQAVSPAVPAPAADTMTHGKIDPFTPANPLAGWWCRSGSLSADSVVQNQPAAAAATEWRSRWVQLIATFSGPGAPADAGWRQLSDETPAEWPAGRSLPPPLTVTVAEYG